MTTDPPGTDRADEAAFAAAARAFLAATLPRKGERGSAGGSGVARAKDYQRRLAEAGFAGITWPEPYGGRGLPQRFQRAFDREAAAFQLPPRALEIGLGMCAPTILAYGTEEQKRALLPAMLRGEHVWCELFSEPGAGSDLAGVQTRAVRDGDVFVVTGQKVWTSGAQHADFAACLTRTDPDRPKREGITMLLVDMHSPGVTVRPLRQITGDAQFNEVFLDAVRVPVANALGAVDGGWRVARTMLSFERRTLGAMGAGGGGRGGFSGLVAAARASGALADGPARQRLADIRARQMALRHLGARLQSSNESIGGQASLLKLGMARLVQDTAAVATDAVGVAAVAWAPDDPAGGRWAAQLLNARSASIGGGTNEVVRNVIAESVLGLPRDVEVDADAPFRELKVGTQRDG
jgi:alkylation response protein AidB-like acyl-CoA dehydrogenase